MQRVIKFSLIIGIALGCFAQQGFAATPTDTPTVTQTWTLTATQSATYTPTPTLTPVVSITPTVTRSVTFTPTTTLTPQISTTPSRTTTSTATLVVENRVRIDRNTMNPMQQEKLEVHGLNESNKNVTIKIFTQRGYLVRTLLRNEPVGLARPSWDGKNEKGEIVASGVYVVVVDGVKAREHFRVVVIK